MEPRIKTGVGLSIPSIKPANPCMTLADSLLYIRPYMSFSYDSMHDLSIEILSSFLRRSGRGRTVRGGHADPSRWLVIKKERWLPRRDKVVLTPSGASRARSIHSAQNHVGNQSQNVG